MAACLLHTAAPAGDALHKSALANGSVLFNNLYFLVATAVRVRGVVPTSASKRRFEDFRLRHELDVNNEPADATIKKLQETEVQLVQSEKMNALGKLSAGLLHEINNPLNFTFMALQVAEQEAGDNAELKETLADISQGMTRIRAVISDLRTFAYPSQAQRRRAVRARRGADHRAAPDRPRAGRHPGRAATGVDGAQRRWGPRRRSSTC